MAEHRAAGTSECHRLIATRHARRMVARHTPAGEGHRIPEILLGCLEGSSGFNAHHYLSLTMTKFLEAIHAALHGSSVRPAVAGAADAALGDVNVAACALLLEVAYADGEFTAPERAHLESVLARHFGLDPEAGERLIAVAEQERRRAVDYFHFTSVLQREYDLGQKMVLAEIMWGLVLADGTIVDREQYLTRKIANLLDLEPAYLAQAKSTAATRRE
jgi:uncharacterized tellurite resistance protein B-like protein